MKTNSIFKLFGYFLTLQKRASVFTLFAFLVCSNFSHSYPSFIGYGYTSCLVCHFNPFGNGPLTDYGRALGATAVSSKPPFFDHVSDQTLGETSGFLGGVKFPDSLRLSADYRGLLLASQIGKEVSDRWRYINMQADLSAAYLASEGRTYAVGTLGYYPTSATGSPKLISREHYVSFKSAENSRLSVGFQDVVFGIRIPDHTAYSRKETNLTQNDQVHGVTWHLGSEHSELGIHGFVGNLYQTPASVRPYGISSTYEFDIAEKVRLGLSGLYSKSGARERIMQATHLRAGVGKGSSLMIELGWISDKPKDQSRNVSNYGFFQSMVRLARGFHFLFTGEYKTETTFKPTPRVFRVGPSFQYFPLQRLELRLDALGTRSLGSDTPIEKSDDINLLGQVHLWF
jgi:hypothetical protein